MLPILPFLLTILFIPFGFAFSWIPTLYLTLWPVIMRTVGRETLVTHALILILFILFSDMSRQVILKLIGFDLISLPISIALIVFLLTDTGTILLDLLKPLFSGLLNTVEPVFLLIELFLFLDLTRRFNKWISVQSNVRDEASHDLSTWEPPLTRSSIIARTIVILITVSSFVGVYLLLQESKSILGEDIPVNFNHAIAALVTLQLIALTATIYKEEGILSESAMVCFLAALPILIAALSYRHLKEDSQKYSSWTSYFPFSLFSSTAFGSSSSSLLLPEQKQQQLLQQDSQFVVFHDDQYQRAASSFDPSTTTTTFGSSLVWPLEGALSQMGFPAASEDFAKQLLLSLLRRLIIIINSLLGLSASKLAESYFGPELFHSLFGPRLLCLLWLSLVWGPQKNSTTSQQTSGANLITSGRQQQQHLERPQRGLLARLPLTRWTFIKLLLVLAYTQMLIQQMDNQQLLQQELRLLNSDPSAATGSQVASSCCGQEAPAAASGLLAANADGSGQDVAGWFQCMWTSAQGCSARVHSAPVESSTRAARLLAYLSDLSIQTLQSVWLARWRSPIVQRLGQSVAVQLFYVGHLMLLRSDHDDDH